MVPEAETSPMPWSMETDVAPVTLHCKVEVPPASIDVGLALNDDITGDSEPEVVSVGVEGPSLELKVNSQSVTRPIIPTATMAINTNSKIAIP